MPGTFGSESFKPPIHEQISDLQRKILLEGERNAYYESSQNTIKKNRERILHLREEHKSLSARLAHTLSGDEQVIREVFQNRSEKAVFRNMPVKAAVQVLDQQMCDRVKKLNAVKHTTNTRRQRLEELQAQYECVRGERRSPQAEESPSRNLRVLENRLEKVQLKCQGAEHIMKSYQKLKQHMQEESLMFQPQLDGLEAEILHQRQELRKLQEMNNDAQLAKEAARMELQCQEEQVYRERKERELILHQYKKQVEERRVHAERGERRAQRVALHPDELSSEAKRSVAGLGEEEKTISSFKEAFQSIKDATGVTDTQELVDRFVSQQETQKHLEEMKVENEAKLQELKAERDALHTHFQEMKYSGESKTSSAQRVLEECECRLQMEQQRRDTAKEKLDWLTHTLTTVSAAEDHLANKLKHIPLPELCVLSDSAHPVVKMLQELEQKLQHLQEELHDKDLNTLLKKMEEEEFLTSIEGNLPHSNTRITLPETQRPNLYKEEDDSGGDEGDVITRASLKRQSQLIIDSKTKRKTRLKKRKGKM